MFEVNCKSCVMHPMCIMCTTIELAIARNDDVGKWMEIVSGDSDDMVTENKKFVGRELAEKFAPYCDMYQRKV